MKVNSRKSAMIGTTILIIIVVVGGYALMWGLSVELRTRYPLEWVGSGSMHPVLEQWDLILVKGVEPSEIQVNDIIIFHQSGYPNLIIHRVVNITIKDSQIYFTTKGDANPVSYWFDKDIPASNVVGKWTGFRIPYAGWAVYILQSPVVGGLTLGTIVSISLIVILLALDYLYPEQNHKEPQKEKEGEALKKS